MSKASLLPKTRSDFWRILPGILISLIALSLVFYFVDWHGFLDALKQADYSFYFLALLVYLISYLFRTWAWRALLKEEVTFKKVFLTMNAGYLLNNILPFRLGELGRAFLLGRSGLGFWRVFSTILIERAFDMILATGLLLGTLPFVVNAPGDWQLGAVVGGLVLAGFAMLYTLARKHQAVISWFDSQGQRWPQLVAAGRGRLDAFLAGLSVLTDFSRFLRVLGFMVFSWGLAIYYQYLLLLAFIPNAKLLWPAFGLATMGLGIALPSSPSYVGIYEAAWVGSLTLFGVSSAIALAYALLGHVTHIIFTGILGVYALAQEGETLGNLFRKIRARPSDISKEA